MIKAIAVDDELLALNVINHFCGKVDNVELCAKFTNAIEALQYIKSNDVDLIFLDINMPQITGVEFVKILDKDIMIIFTTAYQDYAIEGFELEVVDYLLKPIAFDRFKKGVDKAHNLYDMRNSMNNVALQQSTESTESSFIMIRSAYATVRVELDSIICVEGLKDYVKIYTEDKNYVTKITMKGISEHLENHSFMRIHKSYIVNLSKIISFEYNHITLPKSIKVSVGNSYRNAFSEYLKKNKLG